MSKMKKDVFIFGAGLSKAVGAPLQSEILPELLNYNSKKLDQTLQGIYVENLEKVKMFLEKHLLVDIVNQHDLIELEDIFTPIDKAIITNSSYRNLSTIEVIEIRRSINIVISIYMTDILNKINSNNSFIQDFANFIVGRKERSKEDNISFITTNWDIIFDSCLIRGIGDKKGIIDYCTYIAPYYEDENVLPPLRAIGQGYFNIKLLKLHGSLNWLFCTRCGRLYVTYFEKISIHEFSQGPCCRLCNNNYSHESSIDGGGKLVNQILMPTYIKDLNNVQIKQIWQNASVELSESTQIIFIGYSFPTADFELRQLLSKNVPHKIDINVVLGKDRNIETEKRYKTFFGKRNIKFYYNGAEDFLKNYIVEKQK